MKLNQLLTRESLMLMKMVGLGLLNLKVLVKFTKAEINMQLVMLMEEHGI